MPLLFTQKGEQWGRRRNQAVALAMLSLNFSSKASRGFVRDISWDAGLWGRRCVQSRQVDLWVTSLETVIEVSHGFRYCLMWSKNLSLFPASICDSLQQMSPPILSFIFQPLYLSISTLYLPSTACTSAVSPHFMTAWFPASQCASSCPASSAPSSIAMWPIPCANLKSDLPWASVTISARDCSPERAVRQ